MSWNDERTERARKLWREGYSASQIAGAIGGVTRNAVVGKMHRLGESGRVTPTRKVKPVQRSRPTPEQLAERARQQRLNQRPKGPLLIAEPLPEATEELFIPLDQRKGVLDLEANDCRWPVGDPQHADFHFCGRPKHAAFVYCEFHARKAYQPPQAMRRRDRETDTYATHVGSFVLKDQWRRRA